MSDETREGMCVCVPCALLCALTLFALFVVGGVVA